MDNLQRLFAYEIWALRRTFEALSVSPSPRYTSLLIFAHILNAYRVWYDRMIGAEATTTPWHRRSLEQCESLLGELEGLFDGFLGTLDEASLNRVVEYSTTDGAAFENTVREILTQLVLHSSYHRGQVNQLIKQAGGRAAVIDYIVFVREGRTKT